MKNCTCAISKEKNNLNNKAMTKEKIIEAFQTFLSESSKQRYSDFYVGITNDVDRRLFGEHNVDKEHWGWIYAQANDKNVAQLVEEYFLNKGMKGDTGGGTDDTVYVYCYEIRSYTVE